MSSNARIRGTVVQWEHPDWQPLLDLAPVFIDGFMWMHEVKLKTGLRVHAYKHYWTRRYVHVGVDGSAYAYIGTDEDEDRYEKVEPGPLLVEALHDSRGRLCLE